MNDLLLPSGLRNRITSFNESFLNLAQELCRTSPLAANFLGINQEVADILVELNLSQCQCLIQSTSLLATLRMSDPKVWQKLRDGKLDDNEILHAFLRTIPS